MRRPAEAVKGDGPCCRARYVSKEKRRSDNHNSWVAYDVQTDIRYESERLIFVRSKRTDNPLLLALFHLVVEIACCGPLAVAVPIGE